MRSTWKRCAYDDTLRPQKNAKGIDQHEISNRGQDQTKTTSTDENRIDFFLFKGAPSQDEHKSGFQGLHSNWFEFARLLRDFVNSTYKFTSYKCEKIYPVILFIIAACLRLFSTHAKSRLTVPIISSEYFGDTNEELQITGIFEVMPTGLPDSVHISFILLNQSSKGHYVAI